MSELSDARDVEGLAEVIYEAGPVMDWGEPKAIAEAILASDWLAARDAAKWDEGHHAACSAEHPASLSWFEETPESLALLAEETESLRALESAADTEVAPEAAEDVLGAPGGDSGPGAWFPGYPVECAECGEAITGPPVFYAAELDEAVHEVCPTTGERNLGRLWIKVVRARNTDAPTSATDERTDELVAKQRYGTEG